jgi:hypothetical protein
MAGAIDEKYIVTVGKAVREKTMLTGSLSPVLDYSLRSHLISAPCARSCRSPLLLASNNNNNKAFTFKQIGR